MAYNRKNFLLRVKEINEIYKREAAKALPTDYIFRNFIEEQYHISRATFYNFLNIPKIRGQIPRCLTLTIPLDKIPI